MTRMPLTYSAMTEFMSSNDFMARSMIDPMILKSDTSTARAAMTGMSVARASGTLTVRRKTRVAIGPEAYMNASGRLWARRSSRFSTSSESTALILPVLRSSSSPSGALERRSRIRQRTSNRAP